LWVRVQELYAQFKSKDRMDELKLELFLQPKKSPKLRVKAAVVRHFVPILAQLLEEAWPNPCTAHQLTAKSAGRELARCYNCLEQWDSDVLESSSLRFAVHLVALEAEANRASPGTKKWRVKPKLHLFLELCCEVAKSKGCPRDYWTYADESYGGILRNMAELRGGPNNAKRIAMNMLNRVRVTVPIPLFGS
jgi:hypothetical protein